MDEILELFERDVDLTLLHEQLKRSPEERLRALTALQRFAVELRRAGEALRGSESVSGEDRS